MYYGWPDASEAYEAKDQYQFGEDMIVAPIAEAVDKESELASKEIWLPEGEWYEWSTGALLKGPADAGRMLEELFLTTLGRRPSATEKDAVTKALAAGDDRREVYVDLFWALLNSKEFAFNH